MKTSLFFLAILPNSELSQEIISFKEYAAAHFDSKRALTSPPHITLIPPFRWPEGRIRSVENTVKDFSKNQTSFQIELHNFSSFAPRVIFVQPEEHPKLMKLQEDLKETLATQNDLTYKDVFGFHPHITIAFKDLKEDIFPKAWGYFKQLEYKRSLFVDNITLLKHNGTIWDIYQSYQLD